MPVKFQNRKLIIAIDGHSSCGKSTLAKDLASCIEYLYVDSGAMYRAVTLYFSTNGIHPDDLIEVEKNLDNIQISFKIIDGKPHTLLNNQDVEDQIRTPFVASQVSKVSTLPLVRRKLVEQQRILGTNGGIVMDGRDIGTVVFPNADLKIFLTASVEIRTWRRYLELRKKGMHVLFPEIKRNLVSRDHIDSTRKDSPLKKAEDAILLDNSHLSRSEQLDIVLKMVKELK